MQRKKVFISSVQSEFASERRILFDYLTSDALLGKFFEPFIFERTPAKDQSAQRVYLDQVRMCDIYIGLFGEKYGIGCYRHFAYRKGIRFIRRIA